MGDLEVEESPDALAGLARGMLEVTWEGAAVGFALQ